MGKNQPPRPSNIGEYISVLSDNEISSNCKICHRAAKVNCLEKAIETFKDEFHLECKKCLLSISKRKYAFLYMAEYLIKYNKKYFTVKNVKNYIIDEFVEAETIANNLAIIIRDLIDVGAIEVYNRQNDGHRYKVKDLEKLKDGFVAGYAVTKGFNFKDGVKRGCTGSA